MIPAVPNKVNTHVEKILDKLGVEFEPEFVDIKPESYSQEQNCFINVEEKVKRDGGKVHYGWAIFQSQIICEAERHAVWESDEGELIDVTPREFSFEKIMFVSDNNFFYRGQLIDNVRINTTNNPLVDDYIFLCESIEIIYTYGTRLNDDMIIIPEPGLTLVQQYENLKMGFQGYLSSGASLKSPCLCGSGNKYRDCHKKGWKQFITNDLAKIDKAIGHLPRPLKP